MQLAQMEKMGGIGGLMGMLPGMGAIKKQVEGANLDEKMFKRQRAIISSMTPQERKNPDLLKNSRKKRIAAGSGVDVSEINKLLKMHRTMADMMKAMGQGKRGIGQALGSMFGLGGGGMGGGMPGLPACRSRRRSRSRSLRSSSAASCRRCRRAWAGAECLSFPDFRAWAVRSCRVSVGSCRGRRNEHPLRSSRRSRTRAPAGEHRQFRCGADPSSRRALPLHAAGRRAQGPKGDPLPIRTGRPVRSPGSASSRSRPSSTPTSPRNFWPSWSRKSFGTTSRSRRTTSPRSSNSESSQTMALKIRLTRGGAKKRPYYRIVVADARAPATAASSTRSAPTTR